MLRKSKSEIHYSFPSGTAQPAWRQEPPHIGLYAASFDPVHAGHIIFALKSQKLAGLDHVYFMPERQPKHGSEPEHYVHRAVMLRHALKPHRQFSVLDLPDARLNASSLARVRQQLPASADINLLTTASELLWHDGELPKLYQRLHLIVAVTSHSQLAEVLARIHASKNYVQNITFVDIGSNHISSAAVRSGLRQNRLVRGLLPSVARYARRQWLYTLPHHN